MRQLLKDTVYIKAVADPLTGYGKIDKQDKKGDYKMSDKAVLGALNSKRDFIEENTDRNWRVSLEDLDSALALFEAEKMKGKGRPRWPLALAVVLPWRGRAGPTPPCHHQAGSKPRTCTARSSGRPRSGRGSSTNSLLPRRRVVRPCPSSVS